MKVNALESQKRFSSLENIKIAKIAKEQEMIIPD